MTTPNLPLTHLAAWSVARIPNIETEVTQGYGVVARDVALHTEPWRIQEGALDNEAFEALIGRYNKDGDPKSWVEWGSENQVDPTTCKGWARYWDMVLNSVLRGASRRCLKEATLNPTILSTEEETALTRPVCWCHAPDGTDGLVVPPGVPDLLSSHGHCISHLKVDGRVLTCPLILPSITHLPNVREVSFQRLANRSVDAILEELDSRGGFPSVTCAKSLRFTHCEPLHPKTLRNLLRKTCCRHVVWQEEEAWLAKNEELLLTTTPSVPDTLYDFFTSNDPKPALTTNNDTNDDIFSGLGMGLDTDGSSTFKRKAEPGNDSDRKRLCGAKEGLTTCVENLAFQGVGLGPGVCSDIAEIITKCDALTSLELGANQHPGDVVRGKTDLVGVSYLAEALRSSTTYLETISITGNGVNDAFVAGLCSMQRPHLTTLNLSKNNITRVGLETELFPSLAVLDLSHNPLEVTTTFPSSLRTLDLSKSGIDIGLAMRVLTRSDAQLTDLFADCCKNPDRDGLSGFFESQKKLTTVSLQTCGLSESCISSFSEGNFPSLTALHIGGNHPAYCALAVLPLKLLSLSHTTIKPLHVPFSKTPAVQSCETLIVDKPREYKAMFEKANLLHPSTEVLKTAHASYYDIDA
eukprot:TRINITY_DN11853_c1_g2_i1.p1 TRINITY_DN11853_c1_g2~~TRINITY_DN11853_c1_g2_i1.p1  ORF type:complete len:666 (+),score=122.32 TRINITY_DN11853_c1_g2_i1:89-1999(+)